MSTYALAAVAALLFLFGLGVVALVVVSGRITRRREGQS